MTTACLQNARTGPLIALLSLGFGVSFLDQVGINYLLPWLRPALGLGDVQIGLTIAVFCLGTAASSYTSGAWIATHPGRIRPLAIVLVIFAFCSMSGALVSSFPAILVSRTLTGIAAGPILPLTQAIVAASSRPERVGLNMGLVQNVGSNLLGLFLAPLLLAAVATAWGWRWGFCVAGPPSLLIAAILIVFVPEFAQSAPVFEPGSKTEQSGAAALSRSRNVLICAALMSLIAAYVTSAWAFLPRHLLQATGLSAVGIGVAMSILGIASASMGVLIPAVSDRTGPKPAMVAAAGLGMLAATALIAPPKSYPVIAALLFASWAFPAAVTLPVAIIPFRSLPPGDAMRAMGLIVAIGAVIGGFVGPTLAGFSAARWGASAPLYFQILCSAGAAVLASLLAAEKTAKRRNRKGDPSI